MVEPNGGDRRGSAATDVVVPLSVYKIVVVFSTLIAIGSVVGGFLLLDAATRRASLPAAAVDPVLAIAGLGLIVAGAAVYAFGARFRAPGMGKDKDGGTEPTDDG